jgi:hypothetical protein
MSSNVSSVICLLLPGKAAAAAAAAAVASLLLLLLLLLPASAARASKSGSCEVRDAPKLPSSKYCSQACKCGV